MGCRVARPTDGLLATRVSGGELGVARGCYLLSASAHELLGVRGVTSGVGFGVFCLFAFSFSS